MTKNVVLVRERYRDSIDLELRRVSRAGDIVARHSYQALFPGSQLFVVEGVAEGQHRLDVLVLGKLALRLGTDSKSGRIGSQTVRKIPLELLELPEEAVVLRVRNRRTVEDVVLVRRAGKQAAQLGGAAMLLLGTLPWRQRIVAVILGWLLLLLL